MTDNLHVIALRELLLSVKLLLEDGEDEASLSITPYSPGVSRRFEDTLTLNKYVTASAGHGLRCQFSSSIYSAGSFAPGGSRFYSGWPQLAEFIRTHRIRMSELKSSDDHWSNSYHLIQLDFGTDCHAAADFAAFYYEEMLQLRLRTFTYKLKITGA